MTFNEIPFWFTDDEKEIAKALFELDFVYAGTIDEFYTFLDSGIEPFNINGWLIDLSDTACGVEIIYKEALFCCFEDTSEDVLSNKIIEAKQTLESIIKSQQSFAQLDLF
jgi:hypothetical protein